jgi:membrane-associated HD superfamily phosphohydrolase
VSYSNQEIRLRNTIEAKQKDNTSEFDNMWKKISQVSQVSDKERTSLMEVFNSYAKSRSSGDNNQMLMKWIQESIPNVSSDLYKNLQNIIISSRDSWTMRQKELISLNNERNILIEQFPGSLFLSSRSKIEIKIITSSRTEKTFETGKDDSTDLFQK